jgi:hypothetical protein
MASEAELLFQKFQVTTNLAIQIRFAAVGPESV